MKYVAFVFFLFFFADVAFSEKWLSNRSSRTASAETLVRIPGTNNGDTLSSVIVSSCSSTVGAKFRVYDSSAQASGIISELHISTSMTANVGDVSACFMQYDYFIRLSSAITYTTTSGADITILWQNEFGPVEQ